MMCSREGRKKAAMLLQLILVVSPWLNKTCMTRDLKSAWIVDHSGPGIQGSLPAKLNNMKGAKVATEDFLQSRSSKELVILFE